MRVLQNVTATPEQLAILTKDQRGVLVIRGAAGSGKTTTALLRLRVVIDFWRTQFQRNERHLRVLVLTFNRTLAGYIEKLAKAQLPTASNVTIEINTFGKWAMDQVGHRDVMSEKDRTDLIFGLGRNLGLDAKFLAEEVQYVTGLLLPTDLDSYTTMRREGRGVSPQMPGKLREQLLNEVVRPYSAWKSANGECDWGDLALELLASPPKQYYDVVMVDETQDFQANQVRGILRHIPQQHSVTFVLDSAQRIYPYSFRWTDVNINVQGRVHTLSRNYRNTAEIAAFARPLVDGVDIGADGSLPDLSRCDTHGPLPRVLVGRFSAQMRWVVNYIRSSVDLTKESVGFLHPAGGQWFSEVRTQLGGAHIIYETLAREREWPEGDVNVGLSTMHSAKGLEFDHVVILGLNAEVTQHGAPEDSANLDHIRRLLAMAVTRAKKSVIVGYKPGEASLLTTLFKPGTYQLVRV